MRGHDFPDIITGSVTTTQELTLLSIDQGVRGRLCLINQVLGP